VPSQSIWRSSKKPKEKIIGEFKTDLKFIEFIGTKGKINFISNEALIEGKLLSGLGFEDKTFKLTIYEDSTVDFDDVDCFAGLAHFTLDLFVDLSVELVDTVDFCALDLFSELFSELLFFLGILCILNHKLTIPVIIGK
jgi:hypothetical protein